MTDKPVNCKVFQMDQTDGWCTIESDPGVFTELIEDLGVRGLEVQEIVGLDESTLSSLGEVYGLIFLFKYRSKPASEHALSSALSNSNIYFAHQVVNNACATQAILAVILNLPSDTVSVGNTLSEFKEFSKDLDPESRGIAIGNCERIRTAHNSFRPNVSLEIGHENEKEGDAFHFVSYIWFDGKVWELDGLQDAPVFVGECPDREGWLSVAVPAIQARMTDTDIRFNLLALIQDRRIGCKDVDRLRELENQRMLWKRENTRRRHDFMPLGLACLEKLAEHGLLVSLFERHP